MLVIATTMGLGLLAVAGLILYWSTPGQPDPFLDAKGAPLPGSISEKIFVPINGVKQGMIIRGQDSSKPVLLYLHGGMPDYFLSQHYRSGLEELFVVCWWEQRGAGLSFDPAAREPITVDQLVSDTLAVTDYLRQRFGRDRIYLMGHSGGSFIAVQAIARSPDSFAAYIGVAQMANQWKSERAAYDFMLAQYRSRGDRRMVRRLEAAPLDQGWSRDYARVRDEAMHRLGVGTTRDIHSVSSGLVLRQLRSREYTAGEKLNTWRAKAASGVSPVWSEILATDLSQRVPEVKVPVYLLEGVHDRTCGFDEALAYFDGLRAPLKGLYVFEGSAHSPIFEEPEKARRILRDDVLRGTNQLADRR